MYIKTASSEETILTGRHPLVGGHTLTHIAAVLFFVETTAKVNGSSTCTQQKCSCVIPAYKKDIPYAPISEIDFTPAKRKMQNLGKSSSKSTFSQQFNHILKKNNGANVAPNLLFYHSFQNMLITIIRKVPC